MATKEEIQEVIEEVGAEKAAQELCRRGICVSRSEARRQINYFKISTGKKATKEFRSNSEKFLRDNDRY